MAGLTFNHVYKVYPNGVKAVNDFNMEIKDKEFIVLVGPSGCGKSTTLRMIAGLEKISAGELKIGNTVVNDLEPRDRDIAMVFQNYALYPHMTVYKNMAFGLKLRRMPKDVIDKRVRAAAKILGIEEYLNRKPAALSGGQRQRVALGRAIVREPKVFLLDEPLSNLDAKLRASMRSEISKLHKRIGTTFVYVTHDQVEAMTMGDRIVVMKDGFVQQVDTPRNLYHYPCNKFVAGFLGTPQMNFFEATMLYQGDTIKLSFTDVPTLSWDVPYSIFSKANRLYLDGKHKLLVGIRSEHVSLGNKYPFQAKARIGHVEELGNECQVYGDLFVDSDENVADSKTRIILKAETGIDFEMDELDTVSFDLTKMHVFDAETEKTIMPRLPEENILPGKVLKGNLEFADGKLSLPKAVHVNDGDYFVHIPFKAVHYDEKGSLKGRFFRSEEINGTHVVELLTSQGFIFFEDLEKHDFKENEIVHFSIHLTYMSLFNLEGASVLKGLHTANELKCQIHRKKEIATFEDGSKKKAYRYYLLINGVEFVCPTPIATKVIFGGGKKVLKETLSLGFRPHEIAFSEEGLSATVETILDYGVSKYAKCLVGEEEIIVALEKDKEILLGPCHLSIDLPKCSLYDKKKDIRLA